MGTRDVPSFLASYRGHRIGPQQIVKYLKGFAIRLVRHADLETRILLPRTLAFEKILHNCAMAESGAFSQLLYCRDKELSLPFPAVPHL